MLLTGVLYAFLFFFCLDMQAVTAMVQQAMQYIDETPDIDTRIELIKTLNNVSAGKVSCRKWGDTIFFGWMLVLEDQCALLCLSQGNEVVSL